MPYKVLSDSIINVECDVIVNAANSCMLGGGGVDGIIHKFAGPSLKEECEKFPIKPINKLDVFHGYQKGRCDVGEVKVTGSHNLTNCKWIFHTVAPQFNNTDNSPDADSLNLCYQNCLTTLVQMNLKSICFPCLGTGVYNFPKELAKKIAMRTVKEFLKTHPDITVIFCVFDKENKKIYGIDN